MPGAASFKKQRKILVLEPYYGGSHKAFLKGLAKWLPFEFVFLTQPAHKWKWRMRLSAPYFAEILSTMEKEASADAFRCVLCSTFVDVATLQGLAPLWFQKIPLYTYFHENQFVYPVQVEDKRDFHFALTNFTTALASNRLAFNSSYNLHSFIQGCESLLKKSSGIQLSEPLERIQKKATVLFPGIDFTKIDTASDARPASTPVILWNHRWEHDKNPERFFEALFALAQEKTDYGIIILGKSFSRQPAIFSRAQQILADRLLHCGYVRSRSEYAAWLKKADIVVSTATHEFYGISVIEAVRAGCRPLLPCRLSYPELFPHEFLYEEHEFFHKLKKALALGRLPQEDAREMTDRYSWQSVKEGYRDWFGASDENIQWFPSI